MLFYIVANRSVDNIYPFTIHAISVETIFIGCKRMSLFTGDNIYLEQTNSERR